MKGGGRRNIKGFGSDVSALDPLVFEMSLMKGAQPSKSLTQRNQNTNPTQAKKKES